MVEESFVPIEAVAKHFAVSISTVRAWIRQDLVPSLKLGGVYRFKLSEVEQALRKLHGGELVKETVDGTIVTKQKADDPQLALNFNPDDDI
jgi:excisionase family DNA binding protein